MVRVGLVWIAGALGCVGVSLGASGLVAQTARLGSLDFPNSGAAEAQAPFLEGVLFLHNFEYEQAAEAFRRAQSADPDFALAYWGEAQTYNHPVWMEQDVGAAWAVLSRLGETPEDRAAKAGSERERAFLRTVEVLYGTVEPAAGRPKQERDDLYRSAMRRLYEIHPDDHEIGAFYALSILGTSHEGRDFATYMRAAAVVEPIFDANPDHPGAAHYLIHSYDDPIHAPLGLPMARAYSAIAPGAGHAQHMTSHIFVAMGMWDDVVAANIRARDVQQGRQEELGTPLNVCGHYTYWLEYGFLQQGRTGDARDVLDLCYERVRSGANGSELNYFAGMRARYVLDTGDWSAAERYAADLPFAHSEYDAVSALAALADGDVDGAREMLVRLKKTAGSAEAPEAVTGMGEHGAEAGQSMMELQVLPTASGVLAALVEASLFLETDGHGKQHGLELAQTAAAAEASMPYEFGPPAVVVPAYEFVGRALAGMGRPADAVRAFRTQLDRTPMRTASLLGLARAAMEAGDQATAHEAYVTLAEIWRDADPVTEGLEEARRQAGGGIEL